MNRRFYRRNRVVNSSIAGGGWGLIVVGVLLLPVFGLGLIFIVAGLMHRKRTYR